MTSAAALAGGLRRSRLGAAARRVRTNAPPALSIRWRLTVWYTVVVGLTLSVFSLGIYWYLGNSLIRDVDARSRERALQVEQRINQWMLEQQATAAGLLDPAQTQVLRSKGVLVASFDPFQTPGVGVRVWDTYGRLLDASEDLKDTTKLVDYQPIIYALQGQIHRYVMPTGTGDFYSYSYPAFFVNGRPAVVIQILTSLQSYHAAVDRLARLLMLGSVLVAALAFATGAALAQQALKSIDTITRTAEQINHARDLGRRIPQKGPADEIGRLTATVNEMLDRIEAIFDSQRRFLADVSHELRTPLTTIRGEVDLMSRSGRLEAEGLEAIRAESERMSRLVEDLLLLARSHQEAEIERKPVELDTLMLEVFRQATRLAGTERTVSLGHEDAAAVMGDRDRLKQLLLNLVQNALTHTPEGTHVTLSLYRESDGARVEVSDDGPGIPEDRLAMVFERFYRADKARSRARGGTGLGLSIVKWIATAHGGDVTALSRVGEGTTFTVRLPIAPDSATSASRAASLPAR
jgi:two-component system OmpR family sensor kinase